MDITLYYPMKFSQMNLPAVGIGSLIPIPKSLSGKVGSNYDWTYSVYIENMNKADYEEYVQKCIDAGFNKDVSKYENGFFADYSDDIRIEVSYKGNNIVYISITGSMTADYSDYKRKDDSPEQQSSSSSSETSSTSDTNSSEIVSQNKKAFIRDMPSYDVYYMFDFEKGQVFNFLTNDSYVMRGTFTGDFSTGVDIYWVDDGYYETFVHKPGSNRATLIDGKGSEWEFVVCDVSDAQKALDSVR